MDNLDPSGRLLRETTAFFIRSLTVELKEEIDIRGRGYQRFFLFQWALYLFALVRDVLRVPLHDPRGIGQARFRARILYLRNSVRPALEFLRSRYPLTEAQRENVERALRHCLLGEELISDGLVRVLDEWYASMGEFCELQRECRTVAEALDSFCLSLEQG